MKKFLTLLLFSVSLSTYSQSVIKTDQVKGILEKFDKELSESDLADLVITDQYQSKKNNLIHVYFKQRHQGIEIFNATGSIHFRGEKAEVVNHYFYKGLENSKNSLGKWISPEQAFNVVCSKMLIPNSNKLEGKKQIDPNQFEYNSPSHSNETIKIKKYFLKTEKGLVPVWNVSVSTLDLAHWWNVRINAYTGEYIEKNDWVTSCNFGTSGVHNHHKSETHTLFPSILETNQSTQTLANSSYHILPLRVESPNHGNRVKVEDPADSLASPFGWHDTDGKVGAEYTITRGNNVFARDDKDANNSGGLSPDGGNSLIFDHTFDKSKSATLYLDAATTNLFAWNNYMHDVWYHYGFDEASGNFQTNNYNRGSGNQNDQVMADAQDGSGTNNANFATPPDGTSGRMQMFLWGGAASSSNLMHVNSPKSIARNFNGVMAGFGPDLTTTPITKDIVLVDDGSAAPTEGCNAITNGTALNGKIALIDRGNCTFVTKVRNAQTAGAVAVIMINNVNGNPITMGGSTGTITIPSLMISRADGNVLKNALQNGSVNVSLYDSSNSGTVWLDSDFDNGVIAHEYGHGISIRLTGGPSNSNCLRNEEQMGEGWSDFFSLVMTQKLDAKGTDKRGIGTYLRGQGTNGNGIRPFPYSTDMNINPVTYNDIKASRFTVPHGVGSAWCTMLWDLYWAFIDEYGFDADFYEGTGGNNIAMQLVIDGLKLQKCSPGFVDGRDAILEADRINNGGKNQKLIWSVFSRRGLGYSATQGSSNSKSDGVEAFDIPPFLDGMSIEKSAPEFVKSTDTITYSFKVINTADSTIKNIKIIDTLSSDLDFIGVQSGYTFTENSGIVNITIGDINKGDSAEVTLKAMSVNPDNYSKVEFQDSMDNDNGFWTKETDQGNGGFVLSGITSKVGSKSWYITNPSASSDRSLIGEFDLQSTDPILSFYHWYNTEADWDGATIEIDGGSGWEDVGHLMIKNGYNGIISTNPASNISGREAFTGNSEGFIETQIDLGTYQGRKVKIRFRMVTDGAQGGNGWFIDDLKLYSPLVQINNTAYANGDNLNKVQSSASTVITEGKKVGIEQLLNKRIQVYPNPTSDFVNISNPNRYQISYELMNTNGQTLQMNSSKDAQVSINMESYVEGIYFIKINTGDTFETIKIFKKKTSK